jgi:hypothetical protein
MRPASVQLVLPIFLIVTETEQLWPVFTDVGIVLDTSWATGDPADAVTWDG